MNRKGITAFSMIGILVALGACNTAGGPIDEETSAPEEDVGDVDEQPASAVEIEGDSSLPMIEVVSGIRRQVTPRSAEPTAEVHTRTGSYVAIWVEENGTSAVFEGIPAGARSALKEVEADTPRALFVALAGDGVEPPAGLTKGRPFSQLEAEAEAALARLSPEERALKDADHDGKRGSKAAPEQHVMVATTCSQNEANIFYNDFRPGVFDNSEGVVSSTPSNYQYREARRRKDYQAFFQTTVDEWTPTQSNGGYQAAYYRASAHVCSGSARITMYRCANSQGTADNGCGQAGSSIAATFGPFTMNDGGTGSFKDFPGGDISRARLDQMGGASDHAIWSVMGNNGSFGEINGCYY